MFSRLQGEVSASALEAYRRAGVVVYDLLEQVDLRRLERQAEGCDPWSTPPADQALMLCAWNAFVLQNLGDRMLEADYESDSLTPGYVPPVTSAQILDFYLPVEDWVSLALQAQSNPDFRISRKLPTPLPIWIDDGPRPAAHVRRMLQAMSSLSDHAHSAMHFFPQENTLDDLERRSQGYRIRQLLAAANSKARYAESLFSPDAAPDVHAYVEPYIKAAIDGFHLVGQLLAMPHLAVPPAPEPPPVPESPAVPNSSAALAPDTPMAPALEPPAKPSRQTVIPAAPPETPPISEDAWLNAKPWTPPRPEFDPWMLTDPETVAYWKADPKARAAIDELWARDPDPYQTISIHVQIQSALETGRIQYATDANGERIGCFFSCPWGPIYVANRGLTIARTTLRRGDTFVYDVTAEGVDIGGRFRRRIFISDFSATDEQEYGDPNAEPGY